MGVDQESWSILMEDNGRLMAFYVRLMAFYVRLMAFRGIYNQPSSKTLGRLAILNMILDQASI